MSWRVWLECWILIIELFNKGKPNNHIRTSTKARLELAKSKYGYGTRLVKLSS